MWGTERDMALHLPWRASGKDKNGFQLTVKYRNIDPLPSGVWARVPQTHSKE